MNATKMHVMLEIKDLFKLKGMSNEDIADILHKDATVVAKQFAEKNGSQTLATAYGYAEAAGGRIVFVSDELWEQWNKSEKEIIDLTASLQSKEQRLGNLSETVKSMAAQIESQTKIIQRLEKQLDDKDDSIRRKEAVISRKDAIIGELLTKAGALSGKHSMT